MSGKNKFSSGLGSMSSMKIGAVVSDPRFLLKGLVSAAVGALIGVIVSLIVNCTLVEISLNGFFSLYFGLLFFVVGGVILWRASSEAVEMNKSRKPFIVLFGLLVIASGVLCFVLEKDWCTSLSSTAKVPLYSLLGISISFALTFSIVDLLNYFLGFCQPSHSKALVDSASQVYLILITAIIMGAIFGFIFGLMDIEDVSLYQLRLALMKEEHYCYPIGAVVGGLSGFVNEWLRKREGHKYDKLQNPFDDDI
eukprot:GILI01010725.1.p1 GENE.GILI01010725.1~~GILI01010725.1.p1  ORF type:complete len:252 (+),score=74.27 GILI01010725.1:155-910(+)